MGGVAGVGVGGRGGGRSTVGQYLHYVCALCVSLYFSEDESAGRGGAAPRCLLSDLGPLVHRWMALAQGALQDGGLLLSGNAMPPVPLKQGSSAQAIDFDFWQHDGPNCSWWAALMVRPTLNCTISE